MTTPPDSVLLLGQRHPEFGTFTAHRAGSRTAVVISAGAGGETPALRAKGDPTIPNEDALLAVDDGERVLLAVADGHWGHEASHDVVQWLADAIDGVPANAVELHGVLRRMSERPPESAYRARTSLVIAAFDRARGQGVGASYGDSSFAIAAPGGPVVTCNARGRTYISPAEPDAKGSRHRARRGQDSGSHASGDGVGQRVLQGASGARRRAEGYVELDRATRVERLPSHNPPARGRAPTFPFPGRIAVSRGSQVRVGARSLPRV